MAFLGRLPGLAALKRGVRRGARSLWSRDRAELRGHRALVTRLGRMAILVTRGVVVHRVGMMAASLTFFTVFSIIPMLAVVLWGLKLIDHLPALKAERPTAPHLLTGNEMLHLALAEILRAVHRASETTGLLALAALLYAAMKMFSFTERALHTISGAARRRPRYARTLGYVALLLVPPAVLGLAGLLSAAIRWPLGEQIDRLLRFLPELDLALVALLGLGVLWLAATLLYWSAARAQIPFSSASVGGLLSALVLPAVFWVHANFQVGVSRSSAVGSGFLAFPVFLTWSFSSWYVLLVGAEIAVAHHVEAVLVHGARAFRLDLAGEREASLEVLLRVAQAGAPVLSADELARRLRLPPQVVGSLCARLLDRGLLEEHRGALALAFDPAARTVADLVETIERDPALAEAHQEVEQALPLPTRVSPPSTLTLAELATLPPLRRA
jgi:membrane protein